MLHKRTNIIKDFFLKVICMSLFLLFPFIINAATTISVKKNIIPAPIEISGWIPYWRTATGTADAISHIKYFSEISPFGFTVKNDGTIFDQIGIETLPWQNLIQIARQNKVKVIPTIMWSDGDAIDKVLSNPKLRKTHIAEIIKMLNTYNFDGVDIDYEGKKDTTRVYFSIFLHDLYNATGKRLVSCTIEPRTPLTSRFDTVQKDISYANDFVTINKYCDRVRIMTYDQGTIDLRLNETAQGPYNPIADTKWVEKVINLAAQTISKKKIIIGVATYGHEYEVTPKTNGYQYNFLTSFNPKYAQDIALLYGVNPKRNSAGELSFAYVPTSTPTVIQSVSATLNDTSIANTSNLVTSTQSFRFLSWSDASAIKDKIILAKKLGVRGIAIFKIDGGEDFTLWDIIK